MVQLVNTQIDERTRAIDHERIRRNHAEAIRELQLGPLARAVIIRDVVLADGVATPIAHKQGKAVFAIPSAPRGPSTSGRIEELRDGYNLTQFVVLKASGWGASITIDVLVFAL